MSLRPKANKFLSFLIIISILPSCKKRPRAQEVFNTGPEVTIKLQNLTDEDKTKSSFQFEIGQCGTDQNTVGTLTDTEQLKVRLKGVKAGEQCQMKLYDRSIPVDNINFYYERFLKYWAKSMRIAQDVRGNLSATANFAQAYDQKIIDNSKFFTLQVDVNFSKDIVSDKDLKAVLSCKPDIIQFGKFEKKDKQSGSFTFKIELIKAEQEYICTGIKVNIPGQVIFEGSIFEGSGSTFLAKPKALVKLTQDPVVLFEPAATEGVVVTAEPDENCKEDEYFDKETRECKK